MASNSYEVHIWPMPCQNRIYLNSAGMRVNPTLTGPQDRYTVLTPNYPCPACASPQSAHPDVATVPIVPERSAASSSLNPASAVFTPKARQLNKEETRSLFNVPAQPTVPIQHKVGDPCPSQNAQCHWHHSVAEACRLSLGTCNLAKKAASVSFHAGNELKGAPSGWNEQHAKCIRRENPDRCPFHQQLYLDALPFGERARLNL